MAQNGHAQFAANDEPVVVVNYAPGAKDSVDADHVTVSVISGSKQTQEVRVVGSDPGLGSSVEDLEREKREREPMLYCKLITKYPKSAFGVTLGMHLLMVFITGALVQMGYDILPIEFAQLPLDLRDDNDYLRGLAWQERLETDDIIDRNALADAQQTERIILGERMEILFNIDGGNVFTKENLQIIQRVEDEFFNNTKFQDEYCQVYRHSNTTCMKPDSVLRYFDGTYYNISSVFYDPEFNNIAEVLYTAENNNETKKAFQSYLGKDSVLTLSEATSQITLSVLYVGLPLKGYDNSTHEEDDQKKKIEDFMVDQFEDKAKNYFSKGVADMEFCYFSESLFVAEITRTSILDMTLAVGSLFFITIFMCFQTMSLWVSLWSIVGILCAFFTTNLIYRVVLDFRYFGIFHVLAIFIILGIGADDVFILFDTWKETAHYQFPSLAHRVSFVYRRASFAMLFTSLTTAVAFIVSAFSPFLGVSTFGVFSGILISVNYLSVILFLPTLIVTYHLYWDKYKCCCCCQRSHSHDDTNHVTKKKKNPIVRFFAGPYFRFVTHKVARWFILVAFAGVICCFVYYATKLEVNEDQIKFLPDDTNYGKYLATRQSAFRPLNADSTTRVLLVWGMKQQDIGGCHRTAVECFGHNVWDDKFDLNSTEAQEALMGLCQKIRDLPEDKLQELSIRKDLVTKVPEVKCFLEDLNIYLQAEEDSGDYPTGTDLGVPTGQTGAELIMNLKTATRDNTRIYNSSALGDDFSRYFEVAMSNWLYGGFRILDGEDIGSQYFEYDGYLGEAKDPPHTIGVDLGGEYMYYYGTRLRYATIAVNTSIVNVVQAYKEGLDIRDAWEKFFNEQLEDMPDSLKGGFQVSATGDEDFNLWHWLKIQRKLVTTSMLGIIIGVCFALPILIIATQNIVTGLLATGILICITVSVIGLLPMAGWKLGLLESLNFVLVVGLSVDYVVHLAEGYSRSAKPDRLGRLQDTLREVGISVVSGALTTLGASMFLLFAVILFYTQFGFFMFGTIGFSIAYSLGLFVTVMGLIGPENDFGSLGPLFRKCCSKKEK